MATLLMNLRGVPDDEAEEVRALLSEYGIDFYETPSNRWGLSMGAIWLRDDDQADQARELLADYQRQRQAQAQAAYRDAQRAGNASTHWQVLRRHPLRSLLYLVVVGFILYWVTVPFFRLGG